MEVWCRWVAVDGRCSARRLVTVLARCPRPHARERRPPRTTPVGHAGATSPSRADVRDTVPWKITPREEARHPTPEGDRAKPECLEDCASGEHSG